MEIVCSGFWGVLVLGFGALQSSQAANRNMIGNEIMRCAIRFAHAIAFFRRAEKEEAEDCGFARGTAGLRKYTVESMCCDECVEIFGGGVL